MKTVFLIGNGFDLSKGLPTSYKDFFKYYLCKKSEIPHIEKFKKEIGDNHERWADLEEELGKYTANLHTHEELNSLHEDLCRNLMNYLSEVVKHYVCDDSQSQTIRNSLSFPEEFLLPEDKERIILFRKKFGISLRIDVMTFNYTKVLEILLGFSAPMFENRNFLSITLSEIEHIHGTLPENIALGVNDTSQFLNEKLRGNRQTDARYIKPRLNAIRRIKHDRKCLDWINSANLICLYGLSLGVTDLIWWQAVRKRLRQSDVRLLIFHHDQEFERMKIHDAVRYDKEEAIKDQFLERTFLKEDDGANIRDNIIVSINSPIFNIDNTEFKYNDNWAQEQA